MRVNPKPMVVRLAGPDDDDGNERLFPNWAEIEQAIRALDGDSRTLVTLGLADPPVPHMAIGGGEAGRYIVYVTEDNVAFLKLVNPHAAPGKCPLVAGGQLGTYERKLCVDLESALRAAKTYAETGGCDKSLTWER